MPVAALILIFLAAITAANLITTEYGPEASVWTALCLVAFDLVIRDALHDRLEARRRWAVIGLLVLAGGAIAYTINADAKQIALASAAAFTAAMIVDSIVYHAMRTWTWLERSNVSNIAAAVVDSTVFVAVAFPGFMWGIARDQAIAKIAGGLVFALILERVIRVGYYWRGREQVDLE